jgi:putative heme iron utilization protein
MAVNQEQERVAAAAAVLVSARQAALATVFDGAPHVSLVTPALDGEGAPVLLLSTLAAHTRHLRTNPACALLLVGTTAEANPQTAPRLSLTGLAAPAADENVRAIYLKIHPYAAQYAGFADFSFWKITVSTAQYIGGFANAGSLDVAALQHEISARLAQGYG